MSDPSTSFWRKVEAAMDSKTAYYINATIMLGIIGVMGYALMS